MALSCIMPLALLLATIVIATATSRSPSSSPSLFWVSSPALPGTTVSVSGAGLASVSHVVLHLSNGSSATAPVVFAAANGTSLNFVIPASLPLQPMQVALSATSGKNDDKAKLGINVAEVTFALGDGAAVLAASPGGVLRVVGNALAFYGQRGCAAYLGQPSRSQSTSSSSGSPRIPTLLLTPTAGGGAVTVAAASTTCFSAVFALPSTLRMGTYTAAFVGDLPEVTSVIVGTVRVESQSWSPATQLVVQDGASLVAAVKKASQLPGGALITLCAGCTASLTATLVLPNNTVVQGAGPGATLRWEGSAGSLSPVITTSAGNASAPLRVGVHNLEVQVAGGSSGVVEYKAGTVASFVTSLSVTLPDLVATFAMGPTLNMYGPATALRLTDNRMVHGGNCSALHWPQDTALYINTIDGLILRNNTFLCHCQGYSLDSSRNIVVMGNRWVSLGNNSEGSGISSFGTGVSENVYFANNTDIGNPAATKRWESFTYDGPGGVYFGEIASTAGNNLTLAGTASGQPRFSQAGLAVMVMAGGGLGGLARTASYRTHSVTLSAPLPVSPTLAGTLVGDELPALVTVSPFRGNAVFEGNTFTSGTTFQLYGAGYHVIVAGNRFENFGNVGSWGLFYQGGFQPCAYNQWLGNVLLDGGNLHALGQIPPASAPGNYTGAVTFAQIFRANRLCGKSYMHMNGVVDGVLVEDTLLYNSSNGIVVDASVANSWLSNNANSSLSTLCD